MENIFRIEAPPDSPPNLTSVPVLLSAIPPRSLFLDKRHENLSSKGAEDADPTARCTHKEGKRSFTCSDCGFQRATKAAVECHINKLHLQKEPFTCQICVKHKTHNPDSHRQHTKRCGKELKCALCDFLCTKKSHMVRHALVHTKEKKFSCGNCGRRYKHKQGLLEHLRNVDSHRFQVQ